MTDNYADIKSRLIGFSQADEDIRAVIAIGSSTRDDTPADEFSDLDLIIATRDPEKWYSGEYPEKLGQSCISFIEPTLGGGKERRSIYDGGRDVDMIIFTPQQLENAFKEGAAQWVMDRGYKMLYDADGFTALAQKYVELSVVKRDMPQDEFDNIVNDFFFHNIWACKKLLRGELWSAKMCIDSYLKQRLLTVIELCRSDRDVWHDGRFFDSWAGEEILEQLKSCFAHYDTADCAKALLATHELFAMTAREAAKKHGFTYPQKAQQTAAEYLERLDAHSLKP